MITTARHLPCGKAEKKRCVECLWDGIGFFLVGASHFSGAFGLLFFFPNHVMLIFSGVVCTHVFLAGVILPDYFAGVLCNS